MARLRLEDSDQPSVLRKPAALTGQAVGEAAQAGDSLALEVIEEAGWWLGLGLINVAHMTNPEVIVLGGSVVRGLGNLMLDPARRVMAENVVDPVFYHDDLVRVGQLGDDVCLVGAASYARSCSSSAAQTTLKPD
jgi:glucokinase